MTVGRDLCIPPSIERVILIDQRRGSETPPYS
jgi:hypothetical protein